MASDVEAKRRRIMVSSTNGPDPASKLPEAQTFRVPGLVCKDRWMRVPLDYSGKVPGDITLYARELVAPNQSHNTKLPYLLYLQGGPGFEAQRPLDQGGWLRSACSQFRVVLMDQRGTGRSMQVTIKNLARKGSSEQQAMYLSFFRADSIIQDAEKLRELIVPRDNHNGRWTILGQSFGGFCCISYLSLPNAENSLIESLITGGIPPAINMLNSAEAAYRALYRRVITLNERYYTRYPNDVALVQRVVTFLAELPGGGARLPSGTMLRPRTFQLLGLSGLGSGGGFDRLHYLLETFFDPDGDAVNPSFEKSFEAWMPWEANPLYALLHESIYAHGPGEATAWAAHRVRLADPEVAEAFDAEKRARAGQRVYFTGEMVFPWMFEDFAGLRPYKETADVLAAKADWGPLYSPQNLQRNVVPVAAAAYFEDMYVDFDLSQPTAQLVKGLRMWVTNEYKHSGIRDDGVRIFDKLLSHVRDGTLLE